MSRTIDLVLKPDYSNDNFTSCIALQMIGPCIMPSQCIFSAWKSVADPHRATVDFRRYLLGQKEEMPLTINIHEDCKSVVGYTVELHIKCLGSFCN